MEEFHIPLKPEDLARPSVREDEYRVENEVHPELMKEKDLIKLLDDAEGRLLPNSTHQIVSHKNFDMIFGFLNNFASLSSSVRRQLLDLLLRGIGNLTQAISKLITTDKESLEPEEYSHRLLVHKNALKMYTFLLSWLISSLEKSSAAAAEIKPKGKAAGGKKKKADEDGENFWDSESLKEQVLSALVHILEIDLSRVWNLALPEETFLNAISNTMTTLLENPANCKLKSVRRCIFISLGLLVQRYKQAAPLTNALFHRLHNHEHLSSVLAQLMEVLCKEYDSPQVVGEFLREISRMNSKDVPQDSASVRNISAFIGELAELAPQQVLSNVSLLLAHLDSESYTMRNGVIHMVGRLLASNLFANNDAANNGNDKHEAAQTRDSLFKILEDRFHDMNAFCRSKTLQTWAYLLSLHSQQRRIIPLKVLPVVTKLTIGRLEDKGARVREHAIQLLTTLLEANPFGPSLKLSEFRAKLEEGKKALAESEAKGAEADAETEKLRRSLQYYHDSTHFIEQLHSAVPVLGRLLGSKVNADVLETINFFVSATQFQLECAGQGTRKMLPLIWSREAPIREAVTVAYEKLYANLAAVPSKAGAMHVAKNLIALTEGATLAEITSLEELVAMMMAKRSIPPPVIYLLWEIFGLKHPDVQPQESRGALVILSMIATSSPEMVKEKLPVLLGQGLGPRWKEDELLAKYSCIALQKLNDRADKTAQPAPRLRAEHEVFAKLSDVIKDPSPRTQWYSAAEQAVAAVYKLHERPDDLCSSLIKEMAGNLFDETSPKATSSAELSKFVFVLGHVALKQLVHIEEIQSEMRRRREANEKKKEAGGAAKEKDQAKDTQQSQKKKKSAIEEELGLVHGVTDETEADRLREVAERELVGKSLLGQFGALIVKICASPDKYTNPMLRSSAVLALCKFMCVSEPFCREQLPLMFTLLEKSEDSAIRSNIVIALGDMSLRFPNLIEPWTANIYARLRDRDERVKKNALMVLMHLILNDMIKVKGQVYEMAICMESEDSRIAELARLFFSELSRKGNHLYNILPDVISHLSVAPNLSSDAFKSIMKYLLAFIEKDKQTEALVEKLCHRFKNPAQDTVRTPEAEVTHARDVAFCLTVLNYNERVLKKLAECFKLYADKLVDDDVYNCIQQVLAKGRKSSQSKAETKTVIDELAARVEQAHATGVVDGRPMEGLKKPPSVRAAKPAAAKKARGGAKPKARAAKAVSDDEEEELLSLSEDDDDTPPARAAPAEGGKGASRAAPQRRAAAKAKAKAVRKSEESSESESESDGGADEKRPAPKRRVASSDDDAASEVAKAPKAKAGAKRKAKAKAKAASDEEEAADAKKAASDKEAEEAEEVVRKPAARKGRKQIVEDDDSE